MGSRGEPTTILRPTQISDELHSSERAQCDLSHNQTAADGPKEATNESHRGDTEAGQPAAPIEVSVQLTDFVGEHGAYQLAITALLFIRYVLLGLMANSGPLMTPDVTFYCHLPMQEILLIMPNISTLSPQERELEIKEEFEQICQIDLHLYQNYSQLNNLTHTKTQAKTTPLIVAAGQQRQQQVAKALNSTSWAVESGLYKTNATSGEHTSSEPGGGSSGELARIRECTDFTYKMAPDQGVTMTNEFDLVCDRDWLRSLFQSLLSAAVVIAHVFWGTFSDKYGRFQAQRICLVVSLIAGVLSIFAMDFWTFTLMRALCSFGDLGMVVSLTTTVVEIVGSRYRGLSVALVNFGYALGVSLLPYVVAYFENFRVVVGVTVACHAITIPFVLATNESVRWSLTNRKFKQARRELKRISRLNRSCNEFWNSICNCSRWWRKQPKGATPEQVVLENGNGTLLVGTATTLAPASQPLRPESFLSYQEKRKRKSISLREQQRQQREAFELLFKEFIAQIESQNMCDPSASSGDQETAMPESMARQPLGLPVISIDVTRDEDAEADNAHPPDHRHQQSGRVGSIFDDIRYSESPAAASSRTGSTSSCVGRNDGCADDQLSDTRSFEFIDSNRRALSCNYIDKLDEGDGVNALESDPLRAPASCLLADERPAAIELRRQQLLEAKMKTLTLPQLSRESSVCGEESIEAHLRQLRGCDRLQRGASKQQPDCINLVAHQLSFVGRVSRLFKDKKLMICVFTIVWTTFNSELLYTSFIIINLEVGEDVYLNYILGGCMEALAAIMASLLLSYSPRRVSLIAFWLLISFSCFGLSLAHIDSHWAVWMLALAKFSQSCLSSIASVAAYESFPTFLRQSGSGLVFTLGMLGSVFAPLIFAEFDDHAGMDHVLMTFSVSSLTAAILIYLYLNETRDCELQ